MQPLSLLLNLPASMRLFTFDTKWRVLTKHASGSQVTVKGQFNSYKTTLQNLNYV